MRRPDLSCVSRFVSWFFHSTKTDLHYSVPLRLGKYLSSQFCHTYSGVVLVPPKINTYCAFKCGDDIHSPSGSTSYPVCSPKPLHVFQSPTAMPSRSFSRVAGAGRQKPSKSSTNIPKHMCSTCQGFKGWKVDVCTFLGAPKLPPNPPPSPCPGGLRDAPAPPKPSDFPGDCELRGQATLDWRPPGWLPALRHRSKTKHPTRVFRIGLAGMTLSTNNTKEKHN